MFHFIPLRQLTRHKIFLAIFHSENKKTGIVLNLFNLITLNLPCKVFFFPTITV